MTKETTVIGPLEKGVKRKEIDKPPEGTYGGVELKSLPNYISYKASLIREKSNLKLIIGILLTIFTAHYIATSIEISKLHKSLREKEYILAPGVSDFTTVSPQAVPDTYINDAVTDFVSDLGNINSKNVDDQYERLKRFMSDKLKIQFELETNDWIEQVKAEGLSQIFTLHTKTISTDDKGVYYITAKGHAEFYSSSNYIGKEDQVIEMILSLTSPQKGKRWYLQIEKLSVTQEQDFKTKKRLSN